MDMTPERVARICQLRWKAGAAGKRAKTSDPLLGSDCSWADMMDVCEGIAVSIVETMLSREDWRKRETISMRRIIDTAFRNASEPANFYAMPLYLSHGMLLAFEKAGETGSKWPSGHDEHVLPLAVYASGTNLLADPLACIPDLRKALVGPICLVTAEENSRLSRKTHPDPNRPFMRYDGLIETYRVLDGVRVYPETWTFQDHLDLMKKVPAYSTGAIRYEREDDPWHKVRQMATRRMAA